MPLQAMRARKCKHRWRKVGPLVAQEGGIQRFFAAWQCERCLVQETCERGKKPQRAYG